MVMRREELQARVSEMTRSYGDWVIWEAGLPCACRAASGLRMAAGCARCEGEGLVWVNPQKLKGILMPAHVDRRLATIGWLSPADLTLSTEVHHRIQDFDRITLLAPLPVEPEVITRGQAYRDGIPGLSPEEDRLSYQAARPIACVLHDRPLESFIHGDTHVFAGKTLRWLRPPPDGTIYVVKYEALTEWVAFSSPVEVIDRGTSLGQRVLLRKRHLVNLAENPKRDVGTALSIQFR